MAAIKGGVGGGLPAGKTVDVNSAQFKEHYNLVWNRIEGQSRIGHTRIPHVGEERSLQQLQQGAINIRGPHRAGKTELAKYLATSISGRYSLIEPTYDTKEDTLAKIIPSTGSHKKYKRRAYEGEEGFLEAMNAFGEFVSGMERGAALIIDEIIMKDDPKLLGFFSSLADKKRFPKLHVINVLHFIPPFGKEELYRPFFGEFPTHFISPWNVDQAREYVNRYSEDTPFTISDEGVVQMLEATGGRLLEFGGLWLEIMRTTPKYNYEASDVMSIVERMDMGGKILTDFENNKLCTAAGYFSAPACHPLGGGDPVIYGFPLIKGMTST